MARLLVRLKLRLLANTFHRGTQQVLGMLLAWLFGLIAAAIGFMVLAVGTDATAWGERVVLLFAVVWIAWLLLPMLTFASDDTLDPRRFALLPVRPRALVPGLFAAGFVGVGPVATLLGTSGSIVGAGQLGSSPVLAGAIAAAAVGGLLLVCLATSRAVTTAASNLLASRRGRDVMTLAGALLGIASYLAFQGFVNSVGFGLAIDLEPVVEVARWLPGGMAGAAIEEAVRGAPGPALLWLSGVLGWTVLALVAWGAAMERIVVRQPASSSSSRAPSRTSLYPRVFAWLPRTRSTAVAMRFLRSLTRDIRVRTQALQQVFVLFPMIVVSATSGGFTGETAPLYASMLAVPAGFIASNQLGLDGPALWQHVVVGDAPRADLYGRDLALAIVTAPLAAIAAVVLAAVTGWWSYVPAALLVTAATLGVLLGIANAGSVLLPIPVAESPSNLFGSTQSGQGCLNGFLVLIVILVMGVLSLPIVVAILLLDGVLAVTVAAAVAVVYGGLILWAGTELAAARMVNRGPELLAAVDPGRGS